jgi:hypothetical protein
MALPGLVYLRSLQIAVAYLNSLVAVVLSGLLLRNNAGACLDNGNRNNVSVCVKKLSHTELFAHNTLFHMIFLLWLLVGFRQLDLRCCD